MMTRVVFHIGDRKTGTTSLQRLFTDWLGEDGQPLPGIPHYPRAGRWREQRINHVNLAHQTCGDARFNPDLGNWADLGREIAETAAPLVVVSSEGFESADPARMAADIASHLPAGTQVQMVCYLRSHIDRICASYAQNVKTGKYFRPLEVFAARSARGRLGQPFQRLQRWRDHFGDRLEVRAYRRDRLLRQDVLDDFLIGVLRLDPALVATKPQITLENTNPGMQALEAVRRLCVAAGLEKTPDALPAAVLERRFLGPLRETLIRLLPDDPPLRLSPAAADLTHDACLEDAQAIDAAFFADDPCFVAALTESRDKAHAAARTAAVPAELPAPAQAALADCGNRLAAALREYRAAG
ncbi:hypothetical protein GEU84_019180 [Fertoebacter nigrum]|uniref:Uncharacterized protein n=1 Tax=Fertoeibacter niger TaxID=2656921 RepID=A0A8X8KQZ9_9RHOB|nr:hypothetical protein [Fertoeibacter niger]NUB46521.1 hypothetical protein [Fertoeibacter niger]